MLDHRRSASSPFLPFLRVLYSILRVSSYHSLCCLPFFLLFGSIQLDLSTLSIWSLSRSKPPGKVSKYCRSTKKETPRWIWCRSSCLHHDVNSTMVRSYAAQSFIYKDRTNAYNSPQRSHLPSTSSKTSSLTDHVYQ